MSEPTPNPNIDANNSREQGRQEEAWRLRPMASRCHVLRDCFSVCELGTRGCEVNHYTMPHASQDRTVIAKEPSKSSGPSLNSAQLLEAIATIQEWMRNNVVENCPCCGRPR